MHELATLAERRDELDDQELAHLEEQSTLADEHRRARRATARRSRRAAARRRPALAAAEADDRRRAGRPSPAPRASVAARLDAGRARPLRAAAGPLRRRRRRPARGHPLRGCHLDLSTAELDERRAPSAPGEFADCPQCGRLLVP